jgi:hypothetical protein
MTRAARAALALLTALAATGCAQPPADGAPDYGGATAAVAAPHADLTIWAADHELFSWASDAADRIAAATGLVVVVSESPDVAANLPMFWATGIDANGWLGVCHASPASDWIAVNPHTPLELRGTVVLHEMLHGLGAAHVDTGAGVMSPSIWVGPDWALTAADLEAVCAVRDDCSAFVPEG